MRKKRIIPILIALVIILGGAFIIIEVNQYKKSAAFTQEKWINEPNKRYMIVKDMTKKQSFINMTKEEVFNSLGQPDKREKVPSAFAVRTFDRNKSVDLDNENSILYLTRTGQAPEDFDGFYIMFDNNGKVSDYAIIHFSN